MGRAAGAVHIPVLPLSSYQEFLPFSSRHKIFVEAESNKHHERQPHFGRQFFTTETPSVRRTRPVECIFMPFGTVLGVLIILVLAREPVKQLFVGQ